jgi:uncharacterized protein YfaS (alpha-2-macroglobulin family)
MKRLKTALLSLTLLQFIAFSAFGQAPVKGYATQWKVVEDYVKKKLPKSALTEVRKIYDQAKKEKQDAQVVKSLIYIMNLQEDNRENNDIFSIKEYEKEIPASKEPVTSILKSLLAEKYWSYYQNNRYKFFNRTQTVNFVKEDIATWAAEDFYKKISELFLASVANEKLLQQTRLEPFDALLVKGNMRHLRPTLFDLLGNRAVAYFMNDERDVNKPAYAFEIDQASAFDPAADFITRKFPTRDSLSLYQKALILYQELMAFHLKDQKPDALIDVDLARLQFVNSKSVHPDKEQLYFNAINHIAHQYENMPAASQAWFLLASWYENQAAQYKPYGDSTHRLDRLKAKEICDRVLAQKDSSEGKINCYNLLRQIEMKQLQFEMEKVNIPNQAFRVMVNYRNVTGLYLRLIKPDEKLKKDLENQYEDKYWSSILSSPATRSWQQALPSSNDFLNHQAEIKVDALPAGEYLLIASTEKDFSGKNTILGARLFYVSNISFVSAGDDYFVLNRDNGQPLSGASVQLWRQRYDYNVSRNIKEKVKAYTVNPDGFFRKDREKDPNNRYNYTYQLEITHAGEKLFMDDMINEYYYYQDNTTAPKPVPSIFLFIDRSIYRPGQQLYFKGIALTKTEAKAAEILNGYSTTVYLRNPNGQVVDSMNVKANDYGSFSGKFQLPQSGLNGMFAIFTRKDHGNANFRVEDYKRPKFYVEYEPLKETFKANDEIKVTGTAKAYAGNNIDGATVKYRVIRQPRYLYPWLSKRWWLPPAEPMEIAHGETSTDANGKFTVTFTAKPDLKIARKLEPVFDYTVYADVTDLNGETRSGEKMVPVSYKALVIKNTIPDLESVDSLKALAIRTENMNGDPVTANVTVTITKLKEPTRLIRDRFWTRPDQFIMTKEEYVRNFPYDEYNNETDPSTWERGNKVFEKMDTANQKDGFSIQGAALVPGYYVIEMTGKDKNGEEVKDVQYLELYDDKSNQLSKPQYLWSKGSRPIQPGEKTEVKLGSSADNLYIVQKRNGEFNVGMQPQKNSYSFIKLNRGKVTLPITATEADRGGYGLNWMFVKNNRVYQYSQIVTVPWSNKELSIEYATYRDKTLPGSEEKWKLKIKGYKNEKAAAEILASMYDASLDQFNPHAWSEPGIWPIYSTNTAWAFNSNFVQWESLEKRNSYPEYKQLRKEYDYIIGLSSDNVMIRIRGIKSYNGYGNVTSITESGEMFVRGQVVARDAMAAAPQSWNLSVAEQSVGGKRKESFEYDMAYKKVIAGNDGSIKIPEPQSPDVQVRKNFNETAFFFPDLRTDSEGAIEFSFTLPDALTRWKFQTLAHTKDLAFGFSSKEIVTQKQLMVQPNAPRFLREGDKIEFSSKIVNLSEKAITGQAKFQLLDASTNQPVDVQFKNSSTSQSFTLAAGQSLAVKFPIEIPNHFNQPLLWRIVASTTGSGDVLSDGEENALPVLTNRMLVTETISMPMRGTGTKEFKFDKLINSGSSNTLQQHALTVEYTSNPAWYAVQALPYLMEYPYECAEQLWNRYYANSLASYIANAAPRIKQVFERWKITDTAALMSNLQKNQELKSVLLEETPWVLQAKTEAEQKKNIALLFDMVRMSNELSGSYEKFKQLQSSNGGFVWFKGGPDDRFITQYIVSGIGHLKKLNGMAKGQEANLARILSTAIPYLDRKLKEDYDNLVKNKVDLKKYVPGYSEIQYMYMRSFFPDYKILPAAQTAYNYFRGKLPLSWTSQNKYMQGMIALALHRTGDTKTPSAILASLKETAIVNEELGMYWKDNRRGWWWYEAPVERQALMIEAFQEIKKDTKTVDDLRTWLLKNKQTNSWESTKATAEACYALLLQGTQWLTNEPIVKIQLGSTTIQSTDVPQEAGTGYFKKVIEPAAITPSMGNISVTVSSPQTNVSASWGGVYWQYFEDLDKITNAATPLGLVKKLFIERNSDRGPVLRPVNNGDKLKVGDKIKVRIELRVDRDMEYVHMKDMRASCMEPVNVLSNYKYQGGLGYYESTRDASTNFFFGNLRKGTYVFEYPLFVTHTGNFSNGITTIQSMYAPEFSSHSEGIRVNVE